MLQTSSVMLALAILIRALSSRTTKNFKNAKHTKNLMTVQGLVYMNNKKTSKISEVCVLNSQQI